MRRLAVLPLLTALAASPALASARPVSGSALLAIDRSAGFRNFLPTRMLPGFTYSGWSYRRGVLRVDFENEAGWVVKWRVAPMTGSCDVGKQRSFQLGGNEVWWAGGAKEQLAWRCVFALDGKPLRLEAASTAPPAKLGASGLGRVAASAKRY
jgi:hypothetical protein